MIRIISQSIYDFMTSSQRRPDVIIIHPDAFDKLLIENKYSKNKPVKELSDNRYFFEAIKIYRSNDIDPTVTLIK